MTRTTRAPTRLPIHVAPHAYEMVNEQQFRQAVDDRLAQAESFADSIGTGNLSAVSATSTVAATPAATFSNTADATSVAVLTLEGNRATPASGDRVYLSWKLSDSAGNQDEFARISAEAQDATSTSEDGQFNFWLMEGGTLSSQLTIRYDAMYPTVNDGLALGLATNGFSDLHLASGGVQNWANGTYTITQSGASLAFSGAITLGTDLAVTEGGTGASTEVGARANLEVLKCLTATASLIMGRLRRVSSQRPRSRLRGPLRGMPWRLDIPQRLKRV
jgi:hypothetical protein